MAISQYLIKIPQSLGHFDVFTYALGVSFHVTYEVHFNFKWQFLKDDCLEMSKQAEQATSVNALYEKANSAVRLSVEAWDSLSQVWDIFDTYITESGEKAPRAVALRAKIFPYH